MSNSKKEPKVSVIITYYNLGKYIEETIQSAINQTYNNYEIILVNDGSNEEESIIKLREIKIKYKDIITFIDQENSGVSLARNNGIKKSIGEFICCLDGDDILDKSYLEETVNVLLKNNKFGFVTTWVQEFGNRNNLWRTSDYNPIGLLLDNLVHVSSVFRKEIWEKTGKYLNELKGYEDWEFWIRIVSKGYLWTVIKKPLFFYRKRKKSKVNLSNKNREYLINKIIEKNKDFYIKNIKEIINYNDIKYQNELLNYEKIINEKNKYIKKIENQILVKPSTDIKIAILLGSPDISGGTLVIFQHALALQKNGLKVTIITEKPFDHKILDWFLPAKKLKFIDLDLAIHKSYDLCIATWWKTIFYLPKINAHKFVYFVQSIESKFCSNDQNLLSELIESTYSLPLYFITEAHWIQKYLEEKFNQKSQLVLNGIDKKHFNTKGLVIDNNRPYGPRVLVEGALNVFFKQTELAVSVAQEAGVKDIWLLTPTKIESFPGVSKFFSNIPLYNVGEIMRSCDIILKLSKVEGMFGPPLEMMHCGGTVVTFDVTGYDEYIKDGINGIVYPMNDIKSITQGLAKLIKDPKYLYQLKQNGIKTAKKWPDWAISGNKFTKKILEIVENKNEYPVILTKNIINNINYIFKKQVRIE